ncbi:T6SS phospholipase effector Tle1-like catalytic domain-containing protein [Aspergillus undulatus]|uniref:T6SS phospholipase effector Tle1-like catalytic domain-containing protein n=1 Tax=Aspergillus undulatus TaxID=1810928 RepID=UPI003CCD629A
MDHTPTRKEFVLCFDGTGNQFHGDSSDSNVLKIYRMLDHNGSNQYHYYQPGIGTYVTSASLSHKGRIQKLKSAYAKAKAAATGSTFADHVMAGYKFLMRYYCPGDQIYFFGFSRGAYIARFLAEMLDKIGLLDMGNEELVSFAWKTFASWQQRTSRTKAEKVRKEQLKQRMADFKDTFCKPVSQIRFLGLFDTVNSVPRFENAWMKRSKFPYTARTSAKVIRHAVSIDEHRAKFRQDLLSEVKPSPGSGHSGLRRRLKAHLAARPHLHHHLHKLQESPMESADSQEGPCPIDGTHSTVSAQQYGNASVATSFYDGGGDSTEQDIKEVWFPGCHADIGGGWEIESDECSLSYVPLLWMVHNAQLAGLRFDSSKLAHFNCLTVGQAAQLQGEKNAEDVYNRAIPGRQGTSSGEGGSVPGVQEVLRKASTDGKIHDCLRFGNGLSWASVLSWKMMEYLPFRRMDLREDGLWKPVRWPLPRGEVRDMPDDAKIHVSAIRRLHTNSEYRPGNLIMGGGGRGMLKAPKECGTGEWVVADYEGRPLTETYIRKPKSRES